MAQMRALQDQVLSLGTGTRKFTHLVLQMRSGSGILYLESYCRDRDWEWILISPAYETGMGAYLVPGLSKVLGIFHWSRDQEWEFYCGGPVNGNETGNFIYQVPLMSPGRESQRAME